MTKQTHLFLATTNSPQLNTSPIYYLLIHRLKKLSVNLEKASILLLLVLAEGVHRVPRGVATLLPHRVWSQ